MLIIFDLDDTLIDTSGSVTPFKMRECLKRLIAMGFPIDDLDRAHSELLAINAQSLKSLDAIERFISPYRATQEQILQASEVLIEPLPSDFIVSTTPFAREVLAFYHALCPLALVTGGHPPFQSEKLKKAGIDRSIFSMIAIPEDSKKRPCYEAVQREFSADPEDIWVCGDRIAMDLAPAHALGFHTIHMRWGRGLVGEKEKWIDHSISDLRELKDIIR